MTPERIRYSIAKPEFEQFALKLHREHLQTLDRKISHLLYSAVKALTKNLTSKDWRARASAIEQVLKMHGKYVERYNITGSLDHTGQVSHQHQHQHGLMPLDEMTDRQRELAREFLRLTRESREPKALPAAMRITNTDDGQPEIIDIPSPSSPSPAPLPVPTKPKKRGLVVMDERLAPLP